MRRLPVLLTILGISLVACGKDDAPTAPPTTVAVESLSPDGCLNIPAYFGSLQSLDQNLPVLEVTTDFSYQSKRYVRPKFGELMAYTNFRAGTRPLAQFQEFSNISQEGCTAITFHSADGATATYPVTSSTPQSLEAVAEDGRSFSYTWLGPQRMAIDLRYHAFDLPCGSEDSPVLIRQRRVLDWSQAPISALDLGAEPYSMNRTYLQEVANAVGLPIGTLEEDGKILGAKLQEMAVMPPLPELLTCPGGLPPGPDQPDDDEPEVPTDPDTPPPPGPFPWLA